MAIVVEDGTGLANANSYGSVADADAYFADRANTLWAALQEATKEAALITATSYVELRGYGRWIGYPEFVGVQALAFPRTCIYPAADGVPAGIVNATFEYAVRWTKNSTLAPDPVLDATNRLYTKRLRKVGPIEDSYEYNSQQGSAIYSFLPYPVPDAMLVPFMRNAGQVVRN